MHRLLLFERRGPPLQHCRIRTGVLQLLPENLPLPAELPLQLVHLLVVRPFQMRLALLGPLHRLDVAKELPHRGLLVGDLPEGTLRLLMGGSDVPLAELERLGRQRQCHSQVAVGPLQLLHFRLVLQDEALDPPRVVLLHPLDLLA